RSRARRERVRTTVEYGSQRLELSIAKRPDADLRPRQRFCRPDDRRRVAERRERSRRECRHQSVRDDRRGEGHRVERPYQRYEDTKSLSHATTIEDESRDLAARRVSELA